MLWGMRHWMVATLQDRGVPVSVLRAFEVVGGTAVYRQITAMLLLVARDADRPLLVHRPCCAELSADEESIARVLAAFTCDSAAAARLQLRALLGAEPSASLQRYASAVAESFRSVGLSVGIASPG